MDFLPRHIENLLLLTVLIKLRTQNTLYTYRILQIFLKRLQFKKKLIFSMLAKLIKNLYFSEIIYFEFLEYKKIINFLCIFRCYFSFIIIFYIICGSSEYMRWKSYFFYICSIYRYLGPLKPQQTYTFRKQFFLDFSKIKNNPFLMHI